MRYFGKIFVEFWDGNKWNLAAFWPHQYLYGRITGIIGSRSSNKDYRHVPRSMINFY